MRNQSKRMSIIVTAIMLGISPTYAASQWAYEQLDTNSLYATTLQNGQLSIWLDSSARELYRVDPDETTFIQLITSKIGGSDDGLLNNHVRIDFDGKEIVSLDEEPGVTYTINDTSNKTWGVQDGAYTFSISRTYDNQTVTSNEIEINIGFAKLVAIVGDDIGANPALNSVGLYQSAAQTVYSALATSTSSNLSQQVRLMYDSDTTNGLLLTQWTFSSFEEFCYYFNVYLASPTWGSNGVHTFIIENNDLKVSIDLDLTFESGAMYLVAYGTPVIYASDDLSAKEALATVLSNTDGEADKFSLKYDPNLTSDDILTIVTPVEFLSDSTYTVTVAGVARELFDGDVSTTPIWGQNGRFLFTVYKDAVAMAAAEIYVQFHSVEASIPAGTASISVPYSTSAIDALATLLNNADVTITLDDEPISSLVNFSVTATNANGNITSEIYDSGTYGFRIIHDSLANTFVEPVYITTVSSAVSTTSLSSATQDAFDLLRSVIVSDNGLDTYENDMWVTPAVYSEFEAVIVSAQLMAASIDCTQTQIDSALAELLSATAAFEKSIRYGVDMALIEPTGLVISSAISLDMTELIINCVGANSNWIDEFTGAMFDLSVSFNGKTTICSARLSADGSFVVDLADVDVDFGTYIVSLNLSSGAVLSTNMSIEPVRVSDISISSEVSEIIVGETFQLDATIAPTNATNQKINWSTSDYEIGSIDSNGLLTAHKAGMLFISAISDDSMFVSDTIRINIVEPQLQLNTYAINLDLGDRLQLRASGPTNVSWESDNEYIATVDEDGMVTANAYGVATIWVRSDTQEACCVVTISNDSEDYIAVTGVSVNVVTANIEVGDRLQLRATIAPTDATNQSILWFSDDTTIATVSDGLVSGLSPGTTVVYAVSQDGQFIASCRVTINAKSIATTGVTLSENSLDMTQGDFRQLLATVTPTNATNQALVWTSSNEFVATVDETGLVKAVKDGTAVITVKTVDGNFSDSADVEVAPSAVPVTGVSLTTSSISLEKGDRLQLRAVVLPEDATDSSLTWSSTNTNIITVNQSGLVTAAAEGSAYVIVTTVDGEFSAKCLIFVDASVEDFVEGGEEDAGDADDARDDADDADDGADDDADDADDDNDDKVDADDVGGDDIGGTDDDGSDDAGDAGDTGDDGDDASDGDDKADDNGDDGSDDAGDADDNTHDDADDNAGDTGDESDDDGGSGDREDVEDDSDNGDNGDNLDNEEDDDDDGRENDAGEDSTTGEGTDDEGDDAEHNAGYDTEDDAGDDAGDAGDDAGDAVDDAGDDAGDGENGDAAGPGGAGSGDEEDAGDAGDGAGDKGDDTTGEGDAGVDDLVSGSLNDLDEDDTEDTEDLDAEDLVSGSLKDLDDLDFDKDTDDFDNAEDLDFDLDNDTEDLVSGSLKDLDDVTDDSQDNADDNSHDNAADDADDDNADDGLGGNANGESGSNGSDAGDEDAGNAGDENQSDDGDADGTGTEDGGSLGNSNGDGTTDVAVPVIIYFGSTTTMTLEQGENFYMPFITAYDDVDGELPVDIDITLNGSAVSAVNTSVAGTYILRCTATDYSGNVSNPVVITVNVISSSDSGSDSSSNDSSSNDSSSNDSSSNDSSSNDSSSDSSSSDSSSSSSDSSSSSSGSSSSSSSSSGSSSSSSSSSSSDSSSSNSSSDSSSSSSSSISSSSDTDYTVSTFDFDAIISSVKLADIFDDISEDAWYYSDVALIYANGLMTGVSETSFEPSSPATRAQIATILYRLNGNTPSLATPYSDIASTAWYATPVNWASDLFIDFVDDVFSPSENITRQQLVSVLYNYAQTKGYSVNVEYELTDFNDAEEVAEWAVDAFEWAVSSGIIAGKDGGILDPDSTATRAEIACIISRFIYNRR